MTSDQRLRLDVWLAAQRNKDLVAGPLEPSDLQALLAAHDALEQQLAEMILRVAAAEQLVGLCNEYIQTLEAENKQLKARVDRLKDRVVPSNWSGPAEDF